MKPNKKQDLPLRGQFAAAEGGQYDWNFQTVIDNKFGSSADLQKDKKGDKFV